MLFLTEDAARHLAGILSDAPEDAVVRLVPRDDHLAMALDAEQPGDTTFSHDDRTVLALSPPIAEVLGDMTLEIDETPDGPRLVLSGPDE